MRPVEDTPTLWHFRVSHYNEKVRWGFDYKHWPHVRKALIPGFHVPVARRISGQNLLPVVRLDGQTIAGSNRILAELERLRPDPPLFPREPAERHRALALQAHFDEQVAPDLRRLFWSAYVDDPAACARMATDGAAPIAGRLWRALFPVMRPVMRRNMQMDPRSLEASLGRLHGHFDYLAREIGASGYLAGESFSVADLTAAAVMSAIVRPPQFPYPIPEPRPAAFVALRDTVARHAAFAWVESIYARHRGKSWAVVDQ